jgi:hypothetical protein
MFFVRNEMRNDLGHDSHARRSEGYAKDVGERIKQIRLVLHPLGSLPKPT